MTQMLFQGHRPMQDVFQRYFTLEEAASQVQGVTQAFEKAHSELNEIKDQLILYKRITMSREQGGQRPQPHEIAVLQQKWEEYEKSFHRWLTYFAEQGIVIRDLERGLIDFPYRSSQGDDYYLCWHLGEEGIFYFHPVNQGFSGRQPITLLPD